MSQDHGAEGYKGPEVGLCTIPEMGGSSGPTPCPRHCLSLRFWVLQSDRRHGVRPVRRYAPREWWICGVRWGSDSDPGTPTKGLSQSPA